MKKIVNNIEVNSEIDYYSILSVSKDTSKVDIISKGAVLLGYFSSKDCLIKMSEKEKYENLKNIMDAVSVLSDDEAKKAYDNMINGVIDDNVDSDIDNTVDNDIDNTIDSDIDNTVDSDIDNTVDNDIDIDNDIIDDDLLDKINKTFNDDVVDKDDKKDDDIVDDEGKKDDVIKVVKEDTDNKVVKEAKKVLDSSSATKLIVITLICVGAVVAFGSCSSKQAKDAAKEHLEKHKKEVAESVVEEDTEEEIEEEATEEDYSNNATDINEEEETVVEPEEETEEYSIDSIVDKVYEKVLASNDAEAIDALDRDTIQYMVEYSAGLRDVDAFVAYDNYAYLDKANALAATFEGNDSYDAFNNLEIAVHNVDEKNGSYDDEINAWARYGETMDAIDTESDAQVLAFSELCDRYIIGSVAKVAAADQRNGNEGDAYYADDKTISSDSRAMAAGVYNRVRNDQESELQKLRVRAINRK